MAGLNKDQVKVLEGMPGIDQTLLNTYKANNPGSRPEQAVNTAVDPNDAVARVSNFNSALNVAIGKAREQRKDSTLDMLGGVIPSGALPATSFASVLRAFNADVAPLEASLINNAADFAQEQEKRKEEIKTEIRDLALKVGQAGGSQDTVNAIAALIQSGDIDAAVKIAATGLAKKGAVAETASDGTQSIVNKDGEIIFNTTVGMSATKAKEAIKAQLDPQFYAALDAELNDAELRNFYEYWMALNAYRKMTVRADIAYSEWKKAVGEQTSVLGIEEKSTKKTDDKIKSIYDELYPEEE